MQDLQFKERIVSSTYFLVRSLERSEIHNKAHEKFEGTQKPFKDKILSRILPRLQQSKRKHILPTAKVLNIVP